jgi:hypothetical protein
LSQLCKNFRHARADAAALLGVDAVTLRRALKGPDDLGVVPQGKNFRPLYGQKNGLSGDPAYLRKKS